VRHQEPTFEAIRAAVLVVQHRLEAREGNVDPLPAPSARRPAQRDVEVSIPVVDENRAPLPTPRVPRVRRARPRAER
jgi:hypothetical protein